MKGKIEDFGEKIGGARKDLWGTAGLDNDSLLYLNAAEKRKYVNRNSVWPIPNSKKQIEEEGLSYFVACWMREIRKCLRHSPLLEQSTDIDVQYKNYVEVALELKALTMSVRNEKDIQDFYNRIEHHAIRERYRVTVDERWRNHILPNIFYVKYNHQRIQRSIDHNNFPYGRKKDQDGIQKKKSNRKKSFVPLQLKDIQREGEDYRRGLNATEYNWLNEFKFWGVEFGNWLNQKERQVSMNYGYDALRDLQTALDIEISDITFGGTLALAFGARGTNRSGAAHYEPLREVINLTKMHGAGTVAHEWAHALDDKLAKYVGINDGTFASENLKDNRLPDTFKTLVKAFKYDIYGQVTEYYHGSARFDGFFAKDSHGLWGSNTEMFARAFACYVKDTLDRKSDYLIAHADAYVFEYDCQDYSAIPQGEERDFYNELFDQLIYDLKDIGFLHQFVSKKEKEVIHKTNPPMENAQNLNIFVSSNGQLRYF